MKAGMSVIRMSCLLIMIAGVGMFASDCYTPSFPAIAAQFKVKIHWVQVSVTLYLAGYVIAALFYGPLSDRIGRRPTLFIGYLVFIVGTLICIISTSIDSFWLGRFIQALGIGAGSALYRAIMRDIYSGRMLAKMASVIGTLMNCIPPLSPVFGGYIEIHFGWRYVFIFLLLLAVSCVTVLFLQLPETRKSNKKLNLPWIDYFALFKSPVFMCFATAAATASAGLMVLVTVNSYLYQELLGLSPVAFGWLAVFLSPAIALGAFLNSILLGRYSNLTLINVGAVCMFLAGAMLMGLISAGYFSVVTTLMPSALFLMGAGFVFGNAMSAALTPYTHIAGSAGALMSALQNVGGMLGSFCVAHVVMQDSFPLGVSFLVLGCINALALMFARYALSRSN